MRTRLLSFITAVVLATLLGCHQDATAPPPVDPTVPKPDFSLLDVNPNSATHGVQVSPRQYLNSVSAYYFGHAT
jgi:hypothetical protein